MTEFTYAKPVESESPKKDKPVFTFASSVKTAAEPKLDPTADPTYRPPSGILMHKGQE